MTLPSVKPDGSTVPVKVGILSLLLSPEFRIPITGATSSLTDPIIGVTFGDVISTLTVA